MGVMPIINGILNQHELIKELYSVVATPITDLESRRLLDKTLIVITTVFDRPPDLDGGGGSGNLGSIFSCVLAGGGLNHRGAWGDTQDLSTKIVANSVSAPDFFATICAAPRRGLHGQPLRRRPFCASHRPRQVHPSVVC